ncbi:MAG TPA: Na+/H+ antiporter subunit E [Candidatus Competibacter sp.]|nr:Na+/H+ antiporter subunit E [Candidatus Competibacteraceae bacterium]HRC73468.1 Na+/H+ antiporter subunit E [Candidatus Competibacter sp.]
MSRLLPHPLVALMLAAVWLLLANSVAPGQIVLGLLLGWAISLFSARFWPQTPRIHRPLVLLRLVGVVLYDILVANLTVAWLILRSPARLRPAFVRVPLALQSDLAISVLANAICLTPGTVSSRLSSDRRHLLVHALDVGDPDKLVATIKRRYEAPLREIFEPC